MEFQNADEYFTYDEDYMEPQQPLDPKHQEMVSASIQRVESLKQLDLVTEELANRKKRNQATPPKVREYIKDLKQDIMKSNNPRHIVIFRNTSDAWIRFNKKNQTLVREYVFLDETGFGHWDANSLPPGKIWIIFQIYETFIEDPSKPFIPKVQYRTHVK